MVDKIDDEEESANTRDDRGAEHKMPSSRELDKNRPKDTGTYGPEGLGTVRQEVDLSKPLADPKKEAAFCEAIERYVKDAQQRLLEEEESRVKKAFDPTKAEHASLAADGKVVVLHKKNGGEQ